MTSSDSSNGQRPLLTQVLKAIRRRRGLSAADVARAMGIPLRTYEYFEAGQGRVEPGRIRQFADAVDADAVAIGWALEFRSVEFAVRCLDNKLATILLMTLQDFDQAAGDEILRLDARTLIGEFTRTFHDLAAQARDQDAFVERWMSDKSLGGPPDDENDEGSAA